MATLTGVFYEDDGLVRRGLAEVAANKPVPAARQDAQADAVAGATESPWMGSFELELQARKLRREYVSQWFRSLFHK